MKYRKDYVTNSSSSSFIVSRDEITRGHLLDILLKMAQKEGEYYDECAWVDWEDVTGNGVDHFRIKEYKDEPYIVYSWDDEKPDQEFHNVFVVNNEDCGRYNWGIVEEVLKEFGLPLIRGNCD